MTSRTLISSLLLATALSGCRGWTSDKPPVHLIHNMDTQEKGKAYRGSPLFADGRMMRSPPDGTVARGYLRDDDHLSRGEMAGAPATELPAGIEDNAVNVARGQERYGVYCAPCHGRDGDGNGPVAVGAGPSQGKLEVPPPSMFSARVKELPVGRIFMAMTNGVNNGNMSSYAAQIPEHDRWAIALYVKKWAMEKDPTVSMSGTKLEVVDTSKPSSDGGKYLYAAKGCNACHSIDGTKIVGPTFKGLLGSTQKTDKGDVVADAAFIRESILQPGAKIVDGYPPIMPVIPLNDTEIESIVLFLETLK